MEAVQKIFSAIGTWFVELFDRLRTLPQLWYSDRQQFLLIAAIVLAVLLVAVILIVRLLTASHRRIPQAEPEVTTLLPVESSGSNLDVVFLPLADRIAAAPGHVEPKLLKRLVQDAPRSLETVVAAYERAGESARADLLRVVRSQRLMERYAQRLGQDGYTVGTLVQAWQFFPDEEVLKGYVEMLADRSEEKQHWAVHLLGAMQEPKMLPMLVLALVRPETYLPARVAEAFVSMPNESAALLTYMLPEIEDRHKEAVLDIIRQTEAIYDPRNVLDCLRHPAPRIRVAAALALGSGRMVEALPQLLLSANDKQWQVRAAAAKALGLIGDSRAIPCLEGLTHDKEGWVAENARQSLALFHGA